ncbi:MAG: ABC transporter permease, partial [Cupriavidus sp.]|nr:ABC transporter permease [Cupriavidus sp.]
MADAGDETGRSAAERARRAALFAFAWCVVAFLLLPNVIVVGMSFSSGSTLDFPPRGFSLRWYQRYLNMPGWLGATATSLTVGAATAALSVMVGGLAAYALARGRFHGRELGQALILLPIIVPHLVVAIALYRLFSSLGLTGTYAGFVLAHTMLATPFVVTIMVPTIRAIDPALEHAATGLGAGRWQMLRRVTFPLALP